MAAKHTKKEVIEYIKEQLDSGRTVDQIKAHLMSYGHPAEDLDSLFYDVLREEEGVKSRTVSRAVEILYIVIFVIFIFWVGASSKSPGETVIFGFSPTLIYIILTIILLQKMKDTDTTLTLAPLALVFLFFIIGSIGSLPFFAFMEIGKLSVLNLLLCYIFLFAIKYSEIIAKLTIDKEEVFGEEREPKVIKEAKEDVDIPPAPLAEEYVEVKQEEKESLPKLMHSLESHCKALNSVIGRVYRKSNGGNRLMRELIEVKKEWYNQFNELEKTMDKEGVNNIIDKIEKRLDIMFKTEKEMFGKVNFKNLRRNLDGKSRIIDVIIMNDNDPVETYFEESLKICGRIKERI
ncbi:MAG: hypothetical protein KKE20_01765 [Nanoarchaeota archaeon]|nr:hypothetical protein [Nanoarchaeota archaeon]